MCPRQIVNACVHNLNDTCFYTITNYTCNCFQTATNILPKYKMR